LTDPVIAPNGLTYNADAIYPYVNEHGHLPTDNRPVTPSKIWPDQNMRDRLSASPLGDQDAHLEDPITYDTMTHPVVASDGRTYNQSTLEKLFRQNNGISPFSRAQLATTGYRNQTLVTELNPQVAKARNAALATHPTQNLVSLEPVAETDDPPPQSWGRYLFKRAMGVIFVASVATLLATFILPSAFLGAAGVIAMCIASVTFAPAFFAGVFADEILDWGGNIGMVIE
ncbi:MAG: U-box domain-containing protein, partial [Myxococcota bacterium]|nr:U-box domain-containing protein [Myxococcota bacterium]